MSCVVPIDPNSDFSLHNLPFGIFSTSNNTSLRTGVAIGNFVIDMAALHSAGYFTIVPNNIFTTPTLNALMSLGKNVWQQVRKNLIDLLTSQSSPFLPLGSKPGLFLHQMSDVRLHLPIQIGDYTDFYASKEHATNVGTMFRGKENALMPNWTRIPIGYHGRASSIVVSGTDIKRPSGIVKKGEGVAFEKSSKLDFELEMAFVVGTGNDLGTSIPIEKAKDHIFGVVLMNDWSARDIQAFEYQPLGPFLGKSFGTTISPWIVTLDALEPFITELPIQDPKPSDYLIGDGKTYDIQLEVQIKPLEDETFSTISTTNLKYMYWSFQQQLAHHSVNGCNMRTGDLCGTGTISGSNSDSFGSLLELTWNGKNELPLGGVKRTFLQDGDVVKMKGFCSKSGIRVGFGDCVGRVV